MWAGRHGGAEQLPPEQQAADIQIISSASPQVSISSGEIPAQQWPMATSPRVETGRVSGHDGGSQWAARHPLETKAEVEIRPTPSL